MAGLESWGRAQVNVDARGRRRRRGWVCGPLEEGVRACGRDKIGAGRREAGTAGGVESSCCAGRGRRSGIARTRGGVSAVGMNVYGISASVALEFWDVTCSARTCFGSARRTQNGAARRTENRAAYFFLYKIVLEGGARERG